MKKIKEIIVFSEQGDPRNIRTWSNVPHFLVSTLEAKGIIVHTINLEPRGLIQRSIRKFINIIFPRFFKNVFYDYLRTPFHYHVARRKIKKAVSEHKDVDTLLFTTFSLSASGLTEKPSILFCDWTIEHHINYYLDKKPNFLEQSSIDRQNRTIEEADQVFVLFPAIAAIMKRRYQNSKISYIGNVVNNLVESSSTSIQNKAEKKRLLFIGKKKYLLGACNLVEIFKSLRAKISTLELDIIGLNEHDFQTSLPEGVNCFGYLDKGSINDRARYYNLLENASVFINTTPKWGAFSASLEAMYFYTPVIITPYTEFVETFGETINFGEYYKEGTQDLGEVILKVLNHSSYNELCYNANKASERHTWSSFVDSLLSHIESN